MNMKLPKLDERAAFVLFWGALFLVIIASNVLAYTITPIAYDNGIPTTVRISENGETFATLKILNKIGMDDGRLWIQDCGAWNCKVRTEVNFTHDTAYSAGLFTGIVEYEQATFFDKLTKNITWQEPYESPIWEIQNISMSEEDIGCVHNCEETCEAYPYYGEWESNICYVSSALTREELGCHEDCEDVCESPPYYGEWKSDLCYVYLGYYAEELGCEEEVCSEVCEADPYYGAWNGVSCDVSTEVQIGTETKYETRMGWEAIPNGYVFSPAQTYTLGFDYVRSDARDIADLKPVLFGQPVHLWAWWDLANIVNVSACGTYSENNTNYQITQDLTTSATTCLIFDGENNTISGNFFTIYGNGLDAVLISGNNNTLENLTIRGDSTNFTRGFEATGANNTFRFVKVLENTTYGAYFDTLQNGTVYQSCYLNGSTRGYYQPATGDGHITLTNIDAGETGVQVVSGATEPTYGGHNFWLSCTGLCTWQTNLMNMTTNESAIETYVVSINYTGIEPYDYYYKHCPISPLYTDAQNKTIFSLHRNAISPPAKTIDAATSGGTLHMYGWSQNNQYIYYNNNRVFPDETLKYSNRDDWKKGWYPYTTTWLVAGNWYSGFLTVRTTNATMQNLSATLGGIPTYAYPQYDSTPNYSWYLYASCSLTQSPKFEIKWRHPFGNYTSPYQLYETLAEDGVRLEEYVALSTANATYCSHEVLNLTDGIYEVFNFTTGEKIGDAEYVAPLNSTHSWATFECSPREFYSLTSTAQYFTVQAGDCPDYYENVYNFTFYDADSLANLTVNTSTTLAMQVGDYNFSWTQIRNDTQQVSVCKYEGIPEFNGTIHIRFNATGYNTRTMDYTAANTTNTSKELYLSSMTARYAYTFKTINSFNLAVPNATLQIYHYNVADNEYILIDQMNTGFDGATVSYLLLAEPYRIVASAEGYNTLTLDYTTTTITTITITLIPTATGNVSSTDYESMWHDTSFNFTPTGYYYQPPKNVSFQVACDEAFIEYYGMEITRYYNGTNQTVSVLNQSGLSTGGTLQVQLNDTGDYRIQVWFKRENYTEYRPLPYKIYLAERSGLGEVMNIFATKEPISGWGYYMFALLITTVVAGFVSRYTVDGAGVIGLIVLWMLTLLYPMAILTCIGATCINIAMATGLTTLLVGAVMLLRWYI